MNVFDSIIQRVQERAVARSILTDEVIEIIRQEAATAPAGEDARDKAYLDWFDSKRESAKARGFKWDSFNFTTDKPIRDQIDAAMREKGGEA